MRISRAPGRLDVMGGIADYTGSMVCEMPLDRAAAVALQERSDRQLQIFSFNLYDEHKPFTFRIPLDALAHEPGHVLRREFNEPGRKWAAYVAGCLFILHDQKLIDLKNSQIHGMNLAIHSTVPIGAGVSSSAAIEVAAMMNLADHFSIRQALAPMRLAELCQMVENQIVGAPCGIMDQVTSCLGESGSLLRMICQPHELLAPLALPPGVRVLGINSNVRHDIGGPAYARTRCAAFMGHRLILHRMSEMGAKFGKELAGDPMKGYLANLDPDDYKRLFRSALPQSMPGREFLDRFGPTIDPATTIEPDHSYPIQHAVDHHVLEARRVRRFCEFMEHAQTLTGQQRTFEVDRAGHLMYGSHQSYSQDAMLGAPECDLLVQLVRQQERVGLYGARITGGGSGGTVAILANATESADAAIAQILQEYQKQSGREPQAFVGTSSGSWELGTQVISG
jgi:L-arabinokinase